MRKDENRREKMKKDEKRNISYDVLSSVIISYHFSAALHNFSVAMRIGVTLVPIPNTTVKPFPADGT